jgi:hypothetical protein
VSDTNLANRLRKLAGASIRLWTLRLNLGPKLPFGTALPRSTASDQSQQGLVAHRPAERPRAAAGCHAHGSAWDRLEADSRLFSAPTLPPARSVFGSAGQHVFHSDPRLIEDALVLGYDPGEVRAKHHRRDLKNQLVHVCVVRKLSRLARLTQGHDELRGPDGLQLHDAVAGAAGLRGELGRHPVGRWDTLFQ